MSGKSIWQNRIFVRLFSAYTISIIGEFMDFFAISVIVAYHWKTSPLLIGLIPVAFALPGILFSSWAGVFADRKDKRRILIAVDLLVALLTIGIVFVPNIYILYPAILIRATCSVFFMPAQIALTRRVVSDEQLVQATSLNGMVGEIGKIIGPLIGGALITILPPQGLLIIKAGMSLLAAFILFSIGKIKEDAIEDLKSEEKKQSFWQSWKEGWNIVLFSRLLFVTILYGFLVMTVIQLIESQFSVLFRELFPQDPGLMGWTIATIGAGGVVITLWMQKMQHLRYGWALGGGITFMGIGIMGVAMILSSPSIILVLLSAFVVGIGVGIFFVSYNVILQKESAPEVVGRVFGIQNSLVRLSYIVSPLLGGSLVQWIGVVKVYFFVGVLLFAIGCLAIGLRNIIWNQSDKPIVSHQKNIANK